MLNEAELKSVSDCAVCYSTHDDEIHEATLRIHRWFSERVKANLPNNSQPAPELQPEPAAS